MFQLDPGLKESHTKGLQAPSFIRESNRSASPADSEWGRLTQFNVGKGPFQLGHTEY